MATAAGRSISALRVDGGASVMNLLLQLQADQLGVPVARPRHEETTAIGAAFLAGLAEGVWGDLDDVARCWQLDVEVTPTPDRTIADIYYEQWQRAVERSRVWVRG
jgi:glycerol kinase